VLCISENISHEIEKIKNEINIIDAKINIIDQQIEQLEEEKNKKLQEMYTILIQNKEIKQYFDLEVKFNVMLADVNKIIAESVQDVL